MPNGDDHDLLIRIETKLDGLNENFRRHCDENAGNFSVQERDIATAHRRVDAITLKGILSLIALIVTGVGMIVTIIVRTMR